MKKGERKILIIIKKTAPAIEDRGVGMLLDERGDLFLTGLRLAISKQPCFRGKPFSCPLITVFYIQLCWEALVTVQPCSHVRHQLKGV